MEEFVATITPGEEKAKFLRFIRKMLTWDADARGTSDDLAEDEWLMTPDE